MPFLLILLLISSQSIFAEDSRAFSPDYGGDVSFMYGEIQQVADWEEVCSPEFPFTKERNLRAVKEWRKQYSRFVTEIEERFSELIWHEAKQDSGRRKAMLDYFEAKHADAKKQFKQVLLNGGMNTFRKQCENYPLYLKSSQMNLEISRGEIVNKIRISRPRE